MFHINICVTGAFTFVWLVPSHLCDWCLHICVTGAFTFMWLVPSHLCDWCLHIYVTGAFTFMWLVPSHLCHRWMNIVCLFQNQMWPVQFSCTGAVPSDNVWCNNSQFLLLSVCDVIPRAVFQECVLRQWTSPSTNRWEWVLFSVETSRPAL